MPIVYIFVKNYGVAGVFAGTLISTLAVPFFSEPYLLFKHGFHSDCRAFVKKYVGYVLSSFAICTMSFFASSFIKSEGITEVVLKGLISLALPNTGLIAVYGRREEFSSLLRLFVGRLKRK